MVGRLTMQLDMAKKVLGYSAPHPGRKANHGESVDRVVWLSGGYERWKCWSWHIAPTTTPARKTADRRLAADMQLVAGQFPTYGTRRMTHQLRRPPYRYTINRKRVQRIMREKGWLRPVKRAKCRTTN